MSDLINGLRHMADDHPCCQATLRLTIDSLEELERENAALRQQLADIKSVLFAVRADLEPADREPAVLMIGDGIPAALLAAARAKEGQP